jgi:5-methylcytosine-specific restriction endonuclease McrA
MNYSELKDLVINYLEGVCNYCGSTDNLHIHHTLPTYAGGSNTMGNIELLCRSCHNKIHAQLIKIYPNAAQRSIVKRELKTDKASRMAAISAVRNLIRLGIITKKELPNNFRDWL